MRVLNYSLSVNPAFGGVSEAIRQYAREAAQQGHQFDVLTHDPEEQSGWQRDWPGTLLPLHSRRVKSMAWSERASDWLGRNVSRYDAVITHGLWRLNGPVTRRACLRAGIPYLVFVHGMLDPWFARQYPIKHLVKQALWPFTDYLVLRDAAATLFTAQEEVRLASTSLRPFSMHPEVTPLGIEEPPAEAAAQQEAFRGRFPAIGQRRFVLFLARLHEKKGCDLLIEAFAAIAPLVPDVDLVMAGPGDEAYRSSLESIARARGIGDRVIWTGMLSGAEKWGAIRSASLFVLPSHQDNFGIAVVEAMACGVPILLTRQVNIWREIEADGAGWATEDTVAGVEAGLRRALVDDAASLEPGGVRARASFEKRFHIRAATARLFEVLQTTVKEAK